MESYDEKQKTLPKKRNKRQAETEKDRQVRLA